MEFVSQVRPWTYFEGGIAGHVSFADPFDDELRGIVTQAVEGKGVLEGEDAEIHEKGTLVCMGTLDSFGVPQSNT